MAKKKSSPKKKKSVKKKGSFTSFLWGVFFCFILGATLIATAYFIFLVPGPYKAAPEQTGQQTPIHPSSTSQPQFEEDGAPPLVHLQPAHSKQKSVQQTVQKPRIALVIDDMGHRHQVGRGLIELDMGLSFAFLPFTSHTHSLMNLADQYGADILLHLPMEPVSHKWDPGPGGLYTKMSRSAIIAQVGKDLRDVPKAIGVNNHMGSKFTSNKKGMQAALIPIKERSLFFLDSMTSGQSIGYKTAQELGIKTGRRDIFLDNDPNDAKIKFQLEKLIQRAKKNGSAIGIGHPYPATLSTLQKEKGWLQNQVDIVPVSELVASH